jgi:hypothetical protein
LLRAYATQVEALRRLRNGNSQTVLVEHVQHVEIGGRHLLFGAEANGLRFGGPACLA